MASKSSAEQRRERLGEHGGPDIPVHGKIHGEEVHVLPKDYCRSDQEVREDIEEQLLRSLDTCGEAIDVQVANGEVILAGEVGTLHAKSSAEKIASSVIGSKAVKNCINAPSR